MVLQHEIPEATVEYVVNICHENGIKIVLNPAPAREVKKEVLEKITWLTPNEHEAKYYLVQIQTQKNYSKRILRNL